MFNNPLIERYRYSCLRMRQFLVYVTLYVVIITLMLSINYTLYKFQDVFGDIENFFRIIYYQFLAFQIIILWAWGSYNSGSAIRDEVLENTFDFFTMLPVVAYKKAIGILVGKNLVPLLFAAINCLFLVFFGITGKVNLVLQAQIFFTLVSATVLINSVALLASISSRPSKKKTGQLVKILLLFFIVPSFFNGIVALSLAGEVEKFCVGFFTIELPVLLLTPLILIYFSIWAMSGIIRRFNVPGEPLFSRKGALGFMLGYELIILGCFFPYLSEKIEITYCLWLAAFIPLILIMLGSFRKLDKYIEHSRLISQSRPSDKSMLPPLLLYSNFSLAIGLFVMWLALSTGTILAADVEFLPNLYSIAVLFSFYMFSLVLLELYSFYGSVQNRIGLLLGFVFVLYLLLPLILSGIMESEIIFLYSPLGYFANIISQQADGSIVNKPVIVTNLLLCVIPVILIAKRYSRIVTMRKNM